MRIPDVAGRNLRDRTKLNRVVDQRSFDEPAPHADLAAPVLLGVGRAHDVAAQPSLEIDALAPEGRELGRDLAIGHGFMVGIRLKRASATSSVSSSTSPMQETYRWR